MLTKWIKIFKTGTHTDSSGREQTYSAPDLERMKGATLAQQEKSPLVLGHPKDSDPAFGWIAGLKTEGEELFAQFAQVPDEIREAVDTGRYKYVSVSHRPDLSIRHVGLLGAANPGVKGLGEVRFSEEETVEVEMHFNEPAPPSGDKGDPDMTKELEAKLKAAEDAAAAAEAKAKAAEDKLKAKESEYAEQAKAARKETLASRVDKLVEDGKILPADKGKVASFAEALDGEGEDVSFSEGEGKKPLVDHFFEYLNGQPSHELCNEYAGPASAGGASLPANLAAKL